MFSRLVALFGDGIIVLDAEALAGALGPGAVDCLRANSGGGIITLKKYLALGYCFKRGAKAAAVLDSDSVFLPRFEAAKFFATLEHSYYYGLAMGGLATGELHPAITKASHDFLRPGQPQHSDIDASWHGWFYDVPYFRATDFLDMLSYLEGLYPGGWWNGVNFFVFDHMVYTYFRVCIGQADLAFYSDVCDTVPEFLMPAELRAVWSKYNQYPAWISYPALLQDPTLVADNQNVMLVYHADRCYFVAA